jgi:hypothetical protein
MRLPSVFQLQASKLTDRRPWRSHAELKSNGPSDNVFSSIFKMLARWSGPVRPIGRLSGAARTGAPLAHDVLFLRTRKTRQTLDASSFIQGLQLIQSGRTRDASDALVRWMGDEADPVCAFRFEMEAKSVLICPARSRHRDEKFDQISALGRACLKIEAQISLACFLVSIRWLAFNGREADALELLDSVSELIDSPLITYARAALTLRQNGRHVPKALQPFVGPPNDYLETHTCDQPFKRFDITANGGVLACCGVFLPTHIGNLTTATAKDVLNSNIALSIRQSVLDGSFSYCDHIKCPVIYDEKLPEITRISELVHGVDLRPDSPKYLHATHPEKVMFGLDLSCNLACPMCRSGVIAERSSEQITKYEKAMHELMPLLESAQALCLNPSGELFASKVSRALLSKLNAKSYPHLKVNIMTNGLLFTRKEWENFPGIHRMLGFVRVSIDAATSGTYRDVRVGGDFTVLQDNMRFYAISI